MKMIEEENLEAQKIDHIGISVINLEKSLQFYTEVMGIKKDQVSTMGRPGVMRIATITLQEGKIELLEFADKSNPVAASADNTADAVHHIAIKVDNIEEAFKAFKDRGGRLLNERPQQIPGGRKIAFVEIPGTRVLVELMEG